MSRIGLHASLLAYALAVTQVAVSLAAGAPAARAPAADGVAHPAESAVVLEGTVVRVTDGDTVNVDLASGRVRVRLASIDAPERGQPGGREATAALASRVKGHVVYLEPVEQTDGFGRMVAVLWLGDQDINAWMVRQGWAWAFRGPYLHDPQYCALEHQARKKRVGLWSWTGRNYAPWEWRKVRPGQYDRLKDYEQETVEACMRSAPGRSSAPPASERPGTDKRRQPVAAPAVSPQHPSAGEPSASCLIKGNISRSGRIYHLPGGASYTQTVIDEARGERWFCSEQQARDAGWRALRD